MSSFNLFLQHLSQHSTEELLTVREELDRIFEERGIEVKE
jgi:hypothetical protein|tara:strand:+ start:1743 stop:1862 length:120 start_codon:yes stop_codon:yes gene_type:complete